MPLPLPTPAPPRPASPFRVMLPAAAGCRHALSVARAFGDRLLAAAGVVPTPDLAVLPRCPKAQRAQQQRRGGSLSAGSAPSGSGASGSPSSSGAGPAAPQPEEVLVVASDGLWEVVGNDEAVALAADGGSPEAGAAALLDLALARWAARYGGAHQDDVTLAVAWL